ncbi:hypothetical protein PV04_10819 [Phialophora macrospora]|uniref:Uncharacterized protein n=1 Tax=Phialophora macrospora TaxID=1851006 RepID=A0A0D2FRM5_9EURO|nr:hypothetical protein PV04_10819 [Phialophora macrospora]
MVVQEAQRGHLMGDEHTAAATTTSSTFVQNPAIGKKSEDFTIPEWQTMALGWRDFQNDLRYAAQSGVRVWRMKVCVITMHARDI